MSDKNDPYDPARMQLLRPRSNPVIPDQWEHRVAVLESENARLRQDAERYRWLRDNCYVWGSDTYVRSDIQVEPIAMWLRGNVDLTEDGINAAIDAAMEGE